MTSTSCRQMPAVAHTDSPPAPAAPAKPGWALHLGDCLEVLPTLEAGSVDAVITDPPYALVEPRSGGNFYHRPRTDEEKAARRGGFMGKAWDRELPGVQHWQAVLRTLKAGGYLLSFGGTRTYHRLTCAIEDAGFEIRDCLMWLYGSGFPKGRGCLKPAWEPIVLARKPGKGVLPLGIDECRVPGEPWIKNDGAAGAGFKSGKFCGSMGSGQPTRAGGVRQGSSGRYPANVCHDGSDEVMEAFAEFGERKSGGGPRPGTPRSRKNTYGEPTVSQSPAYGPNAGTAARFFYCAKASRRERGEGNTHPTVKPLALSRWLARLVCPPGGTVLDPFAGSGTTGVACLLEGRHFIGIEQDPAYHKIASARIATALADD